jgi:hypothetical protein
MTLAVSAWRLTVGNALPGQNSGDGSSAFSCLTNFGCVSREGLGELGIIPRDLSAAAAM